MAPTISLSPSSYTTQQPAHRFRQGHRDVYYFTLDLATLDGLLPQRIEDSVVREANRQLTPSHARNIQQYLEDKDDWLLGSLLLGIAPDALEFDPYQDDDGNEINPNFGRLSILTNRANTMRIFDGQHRRRAIQDTLDRLSNDKGQADKLAELQASSVPIVLYAEDNVRLLRQMFTDASKTKRIEANVVARFDKRDPFNLAAMHLVEKSKLFHDRVEMDAAAVARGSLSLISVNQLAQALRVMKVGYRSRVSRSQSALYMQDLDSLFESCLAWSDNFLPSARWEYAGILSGDIKNEEIPAWPRRVAGLQHHLHAHPRRMPPRLDGAERRLDASGQLPGRRVAGNGRRARDPDGGRGRHAPRRQCSKRTPAGGRRRNRVHRPAGRQGLELAHLR